MKRNKRNIKKIIKKIFDEFIQFDRFCDLRNDIREQMIYMDGLLRDKKGEKE